MPSVCLRNTCKYHDEKEGVLCVSVWSPHLPRHHAAKLGGLETRVLLNYPVTWIHLGLTVSEPFFSWDLGTGSTNGPARELRSFHVHTSGLARKSPCSKQTGEGLETLEPACSHHVQGDLGRVTTLYTSHPHMALSHPKTTRIPNWDSQPTCICMDWLSTCQIL